MIYYASKNIMDFETRYSRVEKLALAMVIFVQKFCHYILLHETTILANQNPMYYILTHQVLGGKYSRCIRHHAKYYLILNDTLYRCGIDSILR